MSSTPEDSEFTFLDYEDFYDLDGISVEDKAAIFAAIFEDNETSNGISIEGKAAIFAAIFEDNETSNGQTDSGQSSGEEHNSQTDSGQSSGEEHNSIAQAPEEDYCGICMETKPLTEFFHTQFCTHLYCSECVGSYVTDKVLDGKGWINCPEPGCEAGFLGPDACRPMLPQNVIDRWGDLLCAAMIRDKFYCPYKNCSALLMNDDDDDETGVREQEIITRSECPHCNRMFCAQCHSPWHEGMECEEVQELGEGDREREDLMLNVVAGSSQWQRCPECKIFVERDEGCNHITCRCKYEFCYRCGAKWKSSHYSCTGAK